MTGHFMQLNEYHYTIDKHNCVVLGWCSPFKGLDIQSKIFFKTFYHTVTWKELSGIPMVFNMGLITSSDKQAKIL